MPSKRKTIRRLIQTAHFSLKEIYDTQPDISDFALGQIYAYLECLEILQRHRKEIPSARKVIGLHGKKQPNSSFFFQKFIELLQRRKHLFSNVRPNIL